MQSHEWPILNWPQSPILLMTGSDLPFGASSPPCCLIMLWKAVQAAKLSLLGQSSQPRGAGAANAKPPIAERRPGFGMVRKGACYPVNPFGAIVLNIWWVDEERETSQRVRVFIKA